jgi:hypothetical protein
VTTLAILRAPRRDKLTGATVDRVCILANLDEAMAKTSTDRVTSGHPQCGICKHHHEFELPKDVLDAAREHRLVVFAGAGIGTEASSVMPYTFYEDIALDLGKNPKQIKTPFPELMSEYCNRTNGRRNLLQKLKARFDYIEAFPNLIYAATRFHQELSTIPHLDDIVTTNWDPYFETCCGATPFVAAEDFVFWNMPGRKVFKIHGSVNSYSSIVATNEDYARCHKQLTKGIIGSNLKMLRATKVVVFFGYSLRDHDFSRIYDFLKQEMKNMLPHAYAITVSSESAERFSSLGLTPVITAATFFLQILKSHLVAEGFMIPDERFEGIAGAWNQLREEHRLLHDSFSYKQNPELVFCASYQDGLMDAFGRIMQRQMTGEYSCPGHTAALLRKYLAIQSERRKYKKYADVAYIEGYMNGLLYLVAPDRDRKSLPIYFVFGHKEELTTLAKYKKASKKAKEAHRAAYMSAVRIAGKLPNDLEFHHTPFLL